MMDTTWWRQENGSEAVIVDRSLRDAGEGGIWFDRGFFWRGRGDGDFWDLKVIHW
jgi:hypothetical protein